MLIDIDGTFVYNSSKVEQADLDAFKQMEEQSLMAIATGRSVEEINYIERENNICLDYKIGFNGAFIMKKDSKIIYDRPLDEKSLENLIDYLEKNHIIFDALDGKTRFGNFKHEAEDQLMGLDYAYTEDPYSYIRGKKVYKVNLRPKNLEDAQSITKELKESFSGLSVFQVGKRRIEISAEDTSKGYALEELALEQTKTIAIGDSENDISMFNKADISYCMGHAPDYVKETATYVVPRFSDAIAHYLAHEEGK